MFKNASAFFRVHLDETLFKINTNFLPILGSEDEGRGESARPNSFQYLKELSTEERRLSFADRLREALRREAEHSTTTSTGDWSTDSSSYAVGISISGAEVQDNDIRSVFQHPSRIFGEV